MLHIRALALLTWWTASSEGICKATFDTARFGLRRARHAPAAIRAARLAASPDTDVNDFRSVQDTDFADTFRAMLTRAWAAVTGSSWRIMQNH